MVVVTETHTVCAKIYNTEMKRRTRVSVLYILAHIVIDNVWPLVR
jgi:hypothetical protein